MKPLSQQTEIQDAQTGRVSDQVRGLVCHDRSKRRILPYLHPPHSQGVPEVLLSGAKFTSIGSSLRPSTLTPHFTKCVDAALAPLRLQGIRTLHYIDDWLILAQSERVAAQHRDVVLAHLKVLGLRLNAKKSVLSPLQRTTYLGVVSYSTTMQAHMFPARIESILTEVRRVKEGQSTHCQAVSEAAGSDGSCVQRDTYWPAVHETLTVVAQDQGVLPKGKTRFALSRSTLATDASHTGWGSDILSRKRAKQITLQWLARLRWTSSLLR